MKKINRYKIYLLCNTLGQAGLPAIRIDGRGNKDCAENMNPTSFLPFVKGEDEGGVLYYD